MDQSARLTTLRSRIKTLPNEPVNQKNSSKKQSQPTKGHTL